MVAGNIEKKMIAMSNEDLDAKTIEMLLAAAEQIRVLRRREEAAALSLTTLTDSVVELEAANAQLRAWFKEYGRHKNRCEWTYHGACDCGLDAALKEPDSE